MGPFCDSVLVHEAVEEVFQSAPWAHRALHDAGAMFAELMFHVLTSVLTLGFCDFGRCALLPFLPIAVTALIFDAVRGSVGSSGPNEAVCSCSRNRSYEE